MLPRCDQPELERLLQPLTCRVEIPDWYRALRAQHGNARSPVRPDERRRFARFYFLTPALMKCHGNLSVVKRESELFVVHCLDISRNGIAFLHEAPLYPEEELSLWLSLGRKTYTVRRCSRHSECCYEIGAKACGSGPVDRTVSAASR